MFVIIDFTKTFVVENCLGEHKHAYDKVIVMTHSSSAVLGTFHFTKTCVVITLGNVSIHVCWTIVSTGGIYCIGQQFVSVVLLCLAGLSDS